MSTLVPPLLAAAALFALLRWASRWFAALDAGSLAAVAAALEASSSSPSPSSPAVGGSGGSRAGMTPPVTPSLFDEPTRSLSVIVPAFNEEARLPLALDEAFAHLDARRDRLGPGFSFEVVVVDDGSSDGTSRVAEAYARRRGGADAVRVLRMERNGGKGAAVRGGALCARGARLLMMDADGATRASDLDRLDEALDALVSKEIERRRRSVAAGKNGGAGAAGGGGARVLAAAATATAAAAAAPPADAAAFAFASPVPPPAWAVPAAALGSRAHLAPGVAAKRAAHRNLLMRGFRLLVSAVAGDSVRDTQCGFKLFTRGAARVLFGNQRLQRWCFDVELVHLATSRLRAASSSESEGQGEGEEGPAVPLVEVAVNWQEIPGSKVRISSILHMAFEMAAILVGYGTGAWVARGEAELVEAARELLSSSSSAAKKVV